MMLVFGFTFSQERKSETPTNLPKIEKSEKIVKQSKYRRAYYIMNNIPPSELLFYIPKRKRIRIC